jgi:hypothetical protein
MILHKKFKFLIMFLISTNLADKTNNFQKN